MIRPPTHIVVGAGAAGCALAARLAGDPATRVLLVEAGGPGRDPLVAVPMATAILLRGRRHNWAFRTEPVPGFGGRVSDAPRGRVLGGSTAINGMVYVRGLPSDYDGWAQRGMPGWSWERVRPLFLRSERFRGPGGDPAQHGTDGPLTVSRRARPVSPLADAYVEAGLAAGHPACADFNGPSPEGFGYYHFTIRDGRRETAATAFLKRRPPNLTVLTGAQVLRVVIEGGRATGIEVAEGGRTRRIDAEGEVILSAGAIGSPHLLMLSGVGPEAALAAHGIPVLADRAEVGANLQDHLLVRVQHRAPPGAGLAGLQNPLRAGAAFLRAWATGTGPMTVFPLEAGAYLRSPGADLPDIQSHFMPALSSATIRLNPFAPPPPLSGPGFMANASIMRPLSRGRVTLASGDPRAKPGIEPGYLDAPGDVGKLVDAVGMLREVFAQAPFDPWRREELSPGPGIRDRRALAAWVRQTADTVYHLSGTCRMGADAASVVDPALRVRGVAGLRVADASVFPDIPSTNTAAPSIMVGEKAADLVLGRTPD